MERTKILNIPNLLSFYRLLAFPVILGFIVYREQGLFALFLIINLLTDVADGYIARKLKQETEFGAKLDSLADTLTYILALIGIFVFKLQDFIPHLYIFGIYLFLLFVLVFLSLIKFNRLPSFHLYSKKIGGYIQGLFLITLFTIGFITPLFYLMVIWGILSAIEHIAIQLIIKEMKSNVKGIWWVLTRIKCSK